MCVFDDGKRTLASYVPIWHGSALLSAVKRLNNRIGCVCSCVSAELFGGCACIKHMLDLNVLWRSMVLSLDLVVFIVIVVVETCNEACVFFLLCVSNQAMS